MIILDELEFAENTIKNGEINSKPGVTLSVLARYYCQIHNCGYDQIVNTLNEFMEKNYPYYSENDWIETIEKYAAAANKYKLLQCKGVKITEDELKEIAKIGDKVLERLTFTLLCVAKYQNHRNPKNNYWVGVKYSEICKIARITGSSRDKILKYRQLYLKGIIKLAERIDNLNVQMQIHNEESKQALFISDFRELGYEYRLHCGEPFTRCKQCGVLFKNSKTKPAQYCKDHRGYVKQDMKTIICVDCGCEVEVPGNSKRKIRCDACQKEYRKAKDRSRKK